MAREAYYHLYFRNIATETKNIVRKYVEDKDLWSVSKDKGYELLSRMAGELSEVYDIPIVRRVEYGDGESYWIREEVIQLPKISLVSFLHEYRHHMQNHGMQYYDDKEIDARGWSLSVFYSALPDRFEHAWKSPDIGLWFMKPYDPEKM